MRPVEAPARGCGCAVGRDAPRCPVHQRAGAGQGGAQGACAALPGAAAMRRGRGLELDGGEAVLLVCKPSWSLVLRLAGIPSSVLLVVLLGFAAVTPGLPPAAWGAAVVVAVTPLVVAVVELRLRVYVLTDRRVVRCGGSGAAVSALRDVLGVEATRVRWARSRCGAPVGDVRIGVSAGRAIVWESVVDPEKAAGQISDAVRRYGRRGG